MCLYVDMQRTCGVFIYTNIINIIIVFFFLGCSFSNEWKNFFVRIRQRKRYLFCHEIFCGVQHKRYCGFMFKYPAERGEIVMIVWVKWTQLTETPIKSLTQTHKYYWVVLIPKHAILYEECKAISRKRNEFIRKSRDDLEFSF